MHEQSLNLSCDVIHVLNVKSIFQLPELILGVLYRPRTLKFHFYILKLVIVCHLGPNKLQLAHVMIASVPPSTSFSSLLYLHLYALIFSSRSNL